MINKRKDIQHKAGSSQKERKRKGKKQSLQHGVFEFGHPPESESRRTGLNFVEGMSLYKIRGREGQEGNSSGHGQLSQVPLCR